MRSLRLLTTALTTVLLVFSLSAAAQQSSVSGTMTVTAADPQNLVIPDATITISGPNGTITRKTGANGQVTFNNLPPGVYAVKGNATNFATMENPSVQVFVGRTSYLTLKLQPGAVTQTVEVTAPAVTVDTGSTAVGSNLSDNFYTKVPVQRNVTGLFYIAPGAVSGGASGEANPSISGASGLENSYVADGVNITDTAFGGLGVFSRNYGSVGTGINLSFIKEVHVKTAGFEPQYGRATGGVVQIVTKSGSDQFHGALSAFVEPKGFQEAYLNADDPQFGRTNLVGRLLHTAGYDASGELGGYVPGMREHLFFFGSFNPSWRKHFEVAPAGSALLNHGEFNLRTNTYNYAFKGTARLNDNYSLEASVFGDPSHTSTGPFRRLNMDNDTAFSKLDYGTRNVAVRLNSTLSPTWLFNVSGTWGHNSFNEGGFANIQEIIDQTQTDGLPGQRGQFTPVGLGFVENTVSDAYGLTLDTQKVVHKLGEHTLSLGYNMQRPFYDGFRQRSGDTFVIPVHTGTTASSDAFGSIADVQWRLQPAPASCTLCPLMNVPGVGPEPVLLRVFRSEFGLNAAGQKTFRTSGRYHAAYANDSWRIDKHITVNLGLRWEQQRLTGEALSYTFTDNWSPRVGISFDPIGDRKTKFFFNFGRYDYAIPLDLAERSLTNELDMFGMRIAPASVGGVVTLNQFGTVTPIVDLAHILNGVPGGVTNSIGASSESTEAIFPGTKMAYEDEYVGGIEHEFPGGIVASVKYIHRGLNRIVEDTGGISPEAALAGVTQTFSITNVNANTDIFSNPIQLPFTADANGVGTPPAGCDPANDFILAPVQDTFGDVVPPGGVCVKALAANGQPAGINVPDGIPDGFVNPLRVYWAWEFEINKAFSHNWLARVNYRYAKLAGNYEGALRNDNGQTDPAISSLFDFTAGEFNLLGDQFRPGVLNTDRRHVGNLYLSYSFPSGFAKNLTIGTGFRIQSGIPINELKAHPVYENAGEVPVGGRGKLGRTPLTGNWDLHLDYAIPVTEHSRMYIGADLFNILNQRKLQYVDQNADLAFGTPNVDFQKPVDNSFPPTSQLLGTAFQSPFSARALIKFVF